MKPGCFPSCPGLVRSPLFKTGSRHSQDNVFHINILSRDEKLPALILLEMSVIVKHVLVCLTF